MNLQKPENAAATLITVTDTATKLFDLMNTAGSTTTVNAGFTEGANSVNISPEDGAIRILASVDPTGTDGYLVAQGSVLNLRNTDLSELRLIRDGGADVAVSLLVGKSDPSGGEASSVTAADAVGGTVAGANTQVQFNDGGAFGADAGLVYNKTTDALTVGGDIVTVQAIGRDTDNEIAWTTDDQLDIRIGGATTAIVSVTTGVGDNDKLVTQGYVDDSIATVDTWDEVMHLGASFTIAGTENLSATINQNDTTNNPAALVLTNTGSGNDITAPSFSLIGGVATATTFVGALTGEAATVANATLTTALTVDTGTLTLTANVANNSVLTIGAGAVDVSGSNTGDQTDISGTAGDATVLETGRTIGGVSFNGSANIIPNTIKVEDTADATCWVGLWEDATGAGLAPKTDGNLIYDATTGGLTASVLTGTTIAVGAGGLSLGQNPINLTLESLVGDGSFSGTRTAGTAGAILAVGDLVYFDPDDSKWEKCDANAAAAADGDSRGIIGIAVSAAAEDATVFILLNGSVRADAVFPAITINAPVYVSETAGLLTHTPPSTTDAVVRTLGFGVDANSIYFNPSSDYITAV